MKKTLSLILSLVMILSALCTVPLTAHADETIGEWKISYDEELGGYRIDEYTGSDTDVNIPSAFNGSAGNHPVKALGRYSFRQNTTVKNVNIPNGVTKIDGSSFYGCKSLESIKIPSGVTTIESNTFLQCEALKSVDIPNSVQSIETYAFFECTSLENVDIPYGVTTLESHTFQDCYALKHVTIPDTVTVIKNSVFNSCTSLTDVTIPSSVTVIGDFAFDFCESIDEIVIPDKVEYIGEYAFRKTSIESVTIPDSVTVVEYGAFELCPNLKTVRIGSGVTKIGYEAFQNCSKLQNVYIPANVEEIEYRAFGYVRMTSDSGTEFIKVHNYTITGKKGTAAEQYANENGFIFVESNVPTYAVSFSTNGRGTAPVAQTIAQGDKVQKPNDLPNTDGYTFTGWYTDQACTKSYNFNTPVSDDFTLYAGWSKLYINVYFRANGHGKSSQQTIQSGSRVEEPEPLTADGYTFGGWYTDEDCTAAFDFSQPVHTSTYLYAKWTRITPTITFSAGSGSGTMQSQTVDYGAVYELPECTFNAPSGMNFYRWSVPRANGTAGYYEPGESITVKADTTVTAIWNSTINYVDVNVYQRPVPGVEWVKGDELESYDTVRMTLTKFQWYDETAGWPMEMGETFENKHTYRVQINFEAEDGYEFSTDTNGMVDVVATVDGEPATVRVNSTSEKIIIEYTYQALGSYLITYNMNGHGTAPADQLNFSVDFVQKPEDPTADGYIFRGWYRDKACTIPFDFDRERVGEKVLTLYAKWSGNQNTVMFNAMSHGLAPDAQQVVFGETAAQPDAPSERGWMFYGWCYDENGDRDFDFSTPITDDLTLYALWFQLGYKITFDANGHGEAPSWQYLYSGETVQQPANPHEDGYAFYGWYIDEDCTSMYNFDDPVFSEFTLYAKWVEDSVCERDGHKAAEEVKENILPATCTRAGSYDSVIYCSACGRELSRTQKDIPVAEHHYQAVVTAPTCTAKGYTTYTCAVCGNAYKSDYVNALGHKSNKGTVTKAATYTATGTKTYKCTVCGKVLKTETIPKLEKKANPLKAGGKTVTVKYSNLKKKSQTIKQKDAFSVSNAQGKVTYKKANGNKNITVSSAGKVTVKKGLGRGTYNVKVKVTAAGNNTYKSATKIVTVTIKVK
ncbi:MAG: InlB B-repeat-containing protein [Eubacterium sp.]|nr:InlB B-repeat-containing protein [Eubacterium sp.]